MGINYAAVGAKIRGFRRRNGLSQAELSELVGCCPAYISHIERGKKIMSMETLVSLANALQVSTDELLADSLEYPPAAFHHAFAPVVADCSAYERQFLLRVISEIKRALREGTAG
ncbi:MAG: helix-turn-helix transcriptional regulator [Oscillospiraceae bacterium]|jgi:transcriptional regulator with XRE-family HTH domain|nr:helix-turn-helix transcriptional regulator [Oscillospiraceae bacterium]